MELARWGEWGGTGQGGECTDQSVLWAQEAPDICFLGTRQGETFFVRFYLSAPKILRILWRVQKWPKSTKKDFDPDAASAPDPGSWEPELMGIIFSNNFYPTCAYSKSLVCHGDHFEVCALEYPPTPPPPPGEPDGLPPEPPTPMVWVNPPPPPTTPPTHTHGGDTLVGGRPYVPRYLGMLGRNFPCYVACNF